ncbi:hypothetical protein [Polaribacter sp. 20A6]|uniref:hypothetical protein n=1 Tax=Polaribacter sp. 20A6 TaxID=2687289 RepID=UPI0013FDA40D|nr:hypothetical protein [Polaribacter sp. 20A6]
MSSYKNLFSLLALVCLFYNPLFLNAQGEPVTTVYGDYGGFYTSSITTDPKVGYDDSNNLLGFKVDGAIYSTGVNDAILSANNITFTSGIFVSFPMPASIDYNSTELIGIGTN